MRKPALILIIGITISIILYGLFLFFAIKSWNKCDELVILNDGSKIECRGVSSYNDNTTHIRTCDGKLIIIPTIRIKEIHK